MTDDRFPPDTPDEPPVPPLADGGADPTLPGGADPTMAQPAQPHYTTGPGAPPERTSMGAVGAAGVAVGAAGSPGGPPAGSDRPAWLLPAAAGAGAALVVALIAFLVLRGGDDDGSIASTDSTTVAPETTVESGTETTVAPETTVESGTETTVAPDTTVEPGTETTVAPDTTVAGGTDGGGADGGDGDGGDPCAAGYTAVSSLPFGLCSQGDVVASAQFEIARVAEGVDADGFYGPTSFAAVQELQRSLGLVDDGVVTQELLDLLEGTVPDDQFVVASPGTVNLGGQEFPITRTCRTIPFEGQTADYQVISYAFADQFGTSVVHRWFDEGGATGVYFGDTGPITDLESGFGFEFFEGDGSILVSVNPVDSPSDSCVGTVRQFDGGGQQTRVFAVVAACTTGGADRLQLSEGADLTITDTGEGRGTFEFGLVNSFEVLLGSDDDASLVSVDGSTIEADATVTIDGEARQMVATYPSALPNC